jgi:hypothetical protein
MVELAKKFPSAGMLERIAAALEIEPHELFYMPSAAENAINGLRVTVAADIERIVAEAVEKALTAKFNEQYLNAKPVPTTPKKTDWTL